jgi:hypothetical protein
VSATGRKRGRAKSSAAAPLLIDDGVELLSSPPVTGAEFFPTDAWVIDALLSSTLVHLPGGRWLEPCAGTGSIVRTVNHARSDVRWTMCEIDPAFEGHLRPLLRAGDDLLPFGDFISAAPSLPRADVGIFNPPFKHSMAFVEAMLACCGWVAMLNRAGWFGSEGRAPWLRAHTPKYRLTLPKRPSFRPDGGTDSCEYEWFVWPPGDRNRSDGVFAMLDMPRGGQLDLIGGAA